MARVTFDTRNNAFFLQLKQEVDQYFTEHKLAKTGNWRLYIKSVVLIGGTTAMYLLLMNWPATWNVWLALPVTLLMGFFMACIGFSVMHDANHGSYSSKRWLNEMMSLSANCLGANSFFWRQKHNVIHHTYTNVDGIDDDIAKSPIIRHCETQRWVPAHRIQHIYVPFAYALSTLFWIFNMDFRKYFGRTINNTPAWPMKPINHLVFWLTKIGYVTFYIVLPIMIWGAGAWAIGFFAANAAMGLTLSLVFQLAHVVENTEFEHVPLDATKHLETAWAEHQIRTTANFAMDNPVVSWFVGGLNFQIEHHLFPRISHIHYPAISKLVQKCCREHNLPYHYNPTVLGAMASHFRVLKALGEAPALSTTSAAAAA